MKIKELEKLIGKLCIFTATIYHTNKEYYLLKRIFLNKNFFRNHIWLKSQYFQDSKESLDINDHIRFRGIVDIYYSIEKKGGKSKRLSRKYTIRNIDNVEKIG